MTYQLTLQAPGTLGTNAGFGNAAAGFVAGGILVPEDADTALRSTLAQDVLCFTYDEAGVLYVDETTGANNATASDVELLNGTTLLIGDALYVGHATEQFASVEINVGIEGDHAAAVWTWEYWDGTLWSALAGVSANASTIFDGDGTGAASLTFTAPTDWVQNTVNAATMGYWVRARVTTGATVVTVCEISTIHVITTAALRVWTDVTTDLGDAGDDDVSPFQPNLHGTVEDAFYVGHDTLKFCKILFDIGTAAVHTQTNIWEYWDGSAWSTIATLEDKTNNFEASAADGVTLSFVPPSDWAINTTTNGPNSTAGYFIRLRTSAWTSSTTDGTLDEAFMYCLNATGALGTRVAATGFIDRVDMYAQTVSATNNDSIFLLVNATSGASASFTWTGGQEVDQTTVSLAVTDDDEVLIVQIQEDGTTELADATFILTVTG